MTGDDDLFSDSDRQVKRDAVRDVARRGIAAARATLAATRPAIPVKPRQPEPAEDEVAP